VRLRLSAVREQLRASLFLVPTLAVLAAIISGIGALALDDRVDSSLTGLPLGVTSTVESARSLLGVIAGATVSFAGIAFSVSLLTIQLASSQYSPRVVHTLFRDPFNKRVMALVVGTFTYCIVVLRSVRSALDPGGEPIIPNISVAIAVVLGIATILAIVAFINHSAHAMDVSEILERIRHDTISQIRSEWTPARADQVGPQAVPPAPEANSSVIRADCSGWIQQIDRASILRRLPDGATAHVVTAAGRYAVECTPLLLVSPPVDGELDDLLRSTFVIGSTRTMQQDMTYGLRQLVDIAVKAMSPGINDPTTARDAILHASAVLSDLLRYDAPSAVQVDGPRRLVMAHEPSHAELVRIAFEEPRRAAVRDPAVCTSLLEVLDALIESLDAQGLGARTPELHRQARLVLAGCGRSDPLDEDLDVVRVAYATQFGRRG
jgi:uncharacterized membrane protein